MQKKAIKTAAAPTPIGAYSQAIQAGNTVYVSGQIGIDPKTNSIASDFETQCQQIFANLNAIALAVDATLNDFVKLTIYLKDLTQFPQLNAIMTETFTSPFPARATIEVSNLPKNALVEIEGVLEK